MCSLRKLNYCRNQKRSLYLLPLHLRQRKLWNTYARKSWNDNPKGFLPGSNFLRRLLNGYVKRSGRKPSFWGHGSYVAAMWIDTALHKLQADGVSPEELPEVVRNDAVRFIEAIKATSLPDAPTGHIRMTEYNNPIRDIHLVELKKVDGEITPIVFHTFPDTTQFWKIDPEEFLAQPVFSREFPPLKK